MPANRDNETRLFIATTAAEKQRWRDMIKPGESLSALIRNLLDRELKRRSRGGK